MTEKFNGGRGCYICDNCSTTLWVGRDGAEHPENRRFIYTPTEDTVVSDGLRWYCSNKCAKADARITYMEWAVRIVTCFLWAIPMSLAFATVIGSKYVLTVAWLTFRDIVRAGLDGCWPWQVHIQFSDNWQHEDHHD